MVNKIILIVLCFLIHPYYFVITSNILQNQYYDFKRFFYYKITNKIRFVFKILIVLISFYLTFLNEYFCYLSLVFFYEPFNKKKLNIKITKRIIRQIIIFLILSFMNTFLINYSIIIIMAFNLFLYWFSFIFSLLIEKIISFYYLKKALKKINRKDLIIVGITGSYGKTSCKNYLYEFLKNKYNVLKTKESYNTFNGILITINKYLKTYHNVLILEFGVDKKNGMNKFLKFININIALVTAIGRQHLKTFKTIANIAKEKNKLLNHAKDFAILNIDDKNIKTNIDNSKIITVSTKTNADINLTILKEENFMTSLKIKIYKKEYLANCSLLGKHNLENLVCCIGIAKALNIEDLSIIETIAILKNVNHRLSKLIYHNWTIIDDSYNSNIKGFLNAIDLFKNLNTFKVIITPGIIESKNNDLYDKKLAEKIKQTFDLIILIKNPSFEKYIPNKLSFLNFNNAYDYLKEKYFHKSLSILIENDLPEIFIR